MKNGRGVIVAIVLILFGFTVLAGEYLIHREFHLVATLVSFASVFVGAIRLDPAEMGKVLATARENLLPFWKKPE